MLGLKMGNLFMRLIAAAFLFIYLAFSNDWTWIGNVWLLCISTGCWKFQQWLINSIFVHILCCLYMEVRTIKKYGSTFRVAQQQIAVVVWIFINCSELWLFVHILKHRYTHRREGHYIHIGNTATKKSEGDKK